ncbi:uncharacterized protein SCODWIG_02738 [Saccharomycodes ludwigii]|uniref:Mnd1 HTH domain-containing protein n=1 Tax=Saccharomycodes ludwigii TaxID=36035 RepID=A0A376B8I9_9ASCO|nr:uncharacterized protein SCODWIG_02738 [Saccharomycodes ludwigii]
MPPKKKSTNNNTLTDTSSCTNVKKFKKKPSYTIEQKGEIMLEIIQKEHTVYSLKDLEKIIPSKSKGIIHGMIVKDIISYLLDESLIMCEKCGNVNVYWNFPFVSSMVQLDVVNKLTEKKESLLKEIGDNGLTKEKRHEDIELFKKLNLLEKERSELIKKLEKIDTEMDENLENIVVDDVQYTKVCQKNKVLSLDALKKNAILTDNIMTIASYLRDKYGISTSEVFKQYLSYEIDDDFEDKSREKFNTIFEAQKELGGYMQNKDTG